MVRAALVVIAALLPIAASMAPHGASLADGDRTSPAIREEAGQTCRGSRANVGRSSSASRSVVPFPRAVVDSVDSASATRRVDTAAGLRKLPRYVAALLPTVPERARGALGRIPAFERRLLALRGYIRREHRIAANWSWTAKEARSFRATPEYAELLAAVAEVQRRFAAANLGLRLGVNLDVRTFDEQLRSWNRVRSIRVSGRELIDTSAIVLADSTFTDPPDSASLARYRAFLDGYELVNTPTVAVPGLSEHGQLRAFDFKVYRRGRLIAGTTTSTAATVWDSTGLTCRLAEAVCDVSDRFLGPLIEPYEPWHYRFVEHSGE